MMPEKKDKWIPHIINFGNIYVVCQINHESQQVKFDSEAFNRIFPFFHSVDLKDTTLSVKYLKKDDWTVSTD